MSKQNEHKNPVPTVDTIIDNNSQVLFIKRIKEPFEGKMVFPGGFIKIGETAEEAAIREVKEETSLDVELDHILGVYSDPNRDFRHHSVEVAHIAKAYKGPTPGDDAAKAFIVKLEDIPWSELAFDHAQVLRDYIEWRNGNAALTMPQP